MAGRNTAPEDGRGISDARDTFVRVHTALATETRRVPRERGPHTDSAYAPPARVGTGICGLRRRCCHAMQWGHDRERKADSHRRGRAHVATGYRLPIIRAWYMAASRGEHTDNCADHRSLTLQALLRRHGRPGKARR